MDIGVLLHMYMNTKKEKRKELRVYPGGGKGTGMQNGGTYSLSGPYP